MCTAQQKEWETGVRSCHEQKKQLQEEYCSPALSTKICAQIFSGTHISSQQAAVHTCRNLIASHEKLQWTATSLIPNKPQEGSPKETHSCTGAGDHHPTKSLWCQGQLLFSTGPGQSTMPSLHCRARARRRMCIVTTPGCSRRVTIPIMPPNQPGHSLTPPACP